MDIVLVGCRLLLATIARWTPRYSIISAISCDGLIANCLLKNPEERFETRSFIQFLDEQLLPAMNRFDGENPRSACSRYG